MTRFLLDTNIISDVVKPRPSEAVLTWLSAQRDANLFVSALTIAEIRRGILEMPKGRRRSALEAWVEGPEGPQALFAGRVLAFGEEAAAIWARLMAEGKASGRPRSALDMMIAATAEAHDCIVVSLNGKDFEGLPLVDPTATGA